MDEIKQLKNVFSFEFLIINEDITPAQEKKLSDALKVTIIDRTNLILNIFSQRAKSHEGKLQVELAQLEYLSTRLVRGWTHLERQKGGIGVRGGLGKQIELDRRMLRVRVKQLKERLKKLTKQRDMQRQRRRKSGVFTVAIVGYTNAGKSTFLMNSQTKNLCCRSIICYLRYNFKEIIYSSINFACNFRHSWFYKKLTNQSD